MGASRDYRIADSAPASPSAEDAAIRPKVLRRPSQFSHSDASTSDRTADAIEPLVMGLPVAAGTSTARFLPWQEDGRFGLVMIICVMMVNALLGLLVHHITPPATKADATAQNDIPTTMQTAVAKPSSEVTLYSQPAATRRTVQLFDLNHLEPTANTLSLSPRDVPAPRAHLLDDDTEEGISN